MRLYSSSCMNRAIARCCFLSRSMEEDLHPTTVSMLLELSLVCLFLTCLFRNRIPDAVEADARERSSVIRSHSGLRAVAFSAVCGALLPASVAEGKRDSLGHLQLLTSFLCALFCFVVS